MHCSCCDKLLTDYESTLKHAVSGEYLDTCTKCLDGLGIPTRGRPDLKTKKKEDEQDELVDINYFETGFETPSEE